MHLSKTYANRCHKLYEQLEIPPEVTLVHLPEHVTPRPLLPQEVP
jgi:ribonuclease Z